MAYVLLPWLLGATTCLWHKSLWPFGDINSQKSFLAAFLCGPPLLLANLSPVRLFVGKALTDAFFIGHAVAYYYLLFLPLLIAYRRRRSREKVLGILAVLFGIQLVLTLIIRMIVRAS